MQGNELPTRNWFHSARRAVLVVDIVESVRLIEADQVGTITRWREIVAFAEARLAETGLGRMVKSLGDGMLLDLHTVKGALEIAFALRGFVASQNRGRDIQGQLHLRMGIEVGDLMVDQHDIYGHKVNLAARLSGVADPGEIVVSAEVRDLIVPDVDADVEDLGECFLKHVRKPVRAYRVAPPGEGGQRLRLPLALQSMLPTVAVIPFDNPSGRSAIGQIAAEELIRALGQSQHLNLISRLSTAPFAGSAHSLEQLGDLLGASHVLTGSAIEDDANLSLTLELVEVRSKQVLWSDRLQTRIGHFLVGDQDMVSRVAQEVGKAILNRELQRARTLPVRTLESYTLMLAAINAMYRLSVSDFNYANQMLEAVIERNPRHSVPHAWMGQWHVLKVQQGWADDAALEARLASVQTAKALDLNPDCEQALTLDGSVKTHLALDLDTAEQQYTRALGFNPNNALANLLKGMMHTYRGEGAEAAAFSERAQSQSPFDPHQYMYDCLTSAAYYIYGDHRKSLDYAERSLRANSTHTSTLRTLVIAQWMNGQTEAARETVRKLTVLEPGFKVSVWEATNPAARYGPGQKIAEILRQAGATE